MIFNDSIFLVEACFEWMKRLYGSAVFDEWLIADFNQQPPKALYYSGPRNEDFEKQFGSDLESLRGALFAHKNRPGEYALTSSGAEERYDAFIVMAPRIYLICNNTSRSISEIKKHEMWLKAQLPFFDLADKFHRDPLSL